MELPKNVTQIGEANRSCKIYVEDYVISYMKQMNKEAHNKELALALYGTKKEDGEIAYMFLYGACRLNFLQKGTRHLSQAQQQEIEKLRKKYFSNYEFRGYCLLNGEMVEGLYVFEQGICRYITGYAQFYEKNDSMLAYMLDSRQEDAQPEVVEREKYEVVRRRQEERRAKNGEKRVVKNTRNSSSSNENYSEERGKRRLEDAKPSSSSNTSNVNYMKASAVAVFALLCMTGVAAIGDGETKEDIEQAVAQFMQGITEQKLPDAAEVINTNAQVSTLVTEDKLSEALQKENALQTQEMEEQQVLQEITSQDTSLDNQQNPEVSTNQEVQQSPEVSTNQEVQQNSEVSTNPEVQQNAETAANQEIQQNTEISTNQEIQPNIENTENQQDTIPEIQTSTENTTLTVSETQQNNQQIETSATEENVSAQISENVSNTSQEVSPYVIQKGDTLTAISIRNYGTDGKVMDICNLNEITNPDDIKEGQEILLP